jgi:hypothetical protein
MACARSQGQIRDEGIRRLARAVRDEASIAVLPSQFHRVQDLRHRSDLVELDEDGVGEALLDSFPKDL